MHKSKPPHLRTWRALPMPIISPHRHCVSSANTSVQTGSQASPSPKETAAGLDLWAGTQCVYRRWAGITEVRKNCLPCSLVPRRIEITRYWLEGSFKNFIINLTCLELNSLQHTYLQSYFSSQKIASPRCLSQKPKRQAYFFSSPHLCIHTPRKSCWWYLPSTTDTICCRNWPEMSLVHQPKIKYLIMSLTTLRI